MSHLKEVYESPLGLLWNTKLGWMTASWSAAGLRRLSFGLNTLRQAEQSLNAVPLVRDGAWEARRAEAFDLAARLADFARGACDDLTDIPLDLGEATPFRRAVVEACRAVGLGQTSTYGLLAEAAGRPRAARAVGRVMATNPVPLVVPCHRILGSAGALGGYSAPGGLALKRRLLDMEQSSDGKVFEERAELVPV